MISVYISDYIYATPRNNRASNMRIIGLDPMLLGLLFGLSALAVVTAEDLSRRAVPAQQDEATEEETNRLDIGGHLAGLQFGVLGRFRWTWFPRKFWRSSQLPKSYQQYYYYSSL